MDRLLTEKGYDYSLAQFRHPFSCLIAGSSGSGKTQFLTNLLLDCETAVTVPVQRLVYCYGTWLPNTFATLKQKFPMLETYEGLNAELKFNPRVNNFLILDDLMTDVGSSTEVANYFTRGCHHSNMSVFLLTQNLFQQGPFARTISTNANYIVYFKNPRDNLQITNLARQVYPKNMDILTSAFEQATEKPHGYLCMDFKQDMPAKFRLKTNLLPSDPTRPIFFIPE